MKLTELQNEIVTLLIKGKTNSQIAEALNYSVDKIKKDLKGIYKFYGIDGPAETKRAVLIREVVKTEMTKLMM